MVRISDLVRGKTSTPASADDGRMDNMRLSNLTELIRLNTKTSPYISPESPEKLLTKPPEKPAEQPHENHLEKRPEQQLLPISDNLVTPGGKNLYLDAQNYLREARNRVLAGEPIGLEKPVGMIERMIAEPSLIDEMYGLTLAIEHGDDLEIASPVNSMIYCFKMGVRMGYTSLNLTEICLAALHHDIGMFLIPQVIIRKEGKLNAADLAEIRKHPEIGRDLSRSYDLTYPNVSRAIYEHHERENGQGYPSGIKDEEISEYAKIIGICDSYEAMTHDRPHKKARAQYISVLQLAETKDVLFAPHIVKVFLDVMTLYPIGSYVRLNNKAIGVVVQTNQNNPFKPTVRIVTDGQGNRILDEHLINLAEDNILNIVAGISADEIPA
jgi:HD-GYP domain-containing protein (c-di-GMP phosphodiesterase class II)